MKELTFVAIAVVVLFSSWLAVSSTGVSNQRETFDNASKIDAMAASQARVQNEQGVEVAFNGPEGFIPPPLHPRDVQLKTVELSDGVYALLSGDVAVDNSGFVVGDQGVLVIDSHINGEMAQQIIDAVQEVTQKPILYLVNTNYHGDHTFGNYAFPAETTIVAHRNTFENMKNFEFEREFMLATVEHDSSVFSDSLLRLPDITFEDQLTIDLGNRIVELHYFGHGNTPGDTIVYVPSASAAWTGNLVLGEGTIPFLIEGRATEYIETIATFSRSLDLDTIIPGHGFVTSPSIFGSYLSYLNELIDAVRGEVSAGSSLESALGNLPLSASFDPGPEFFARDFVLGIHKWNVQTTFLEFFESRELEDATTTN